MFGRRSLVLTNYYYENAQIVIGLVCSTSEILNSSKIERRRQIINIVLQNLELYGRELRWKYKKPFNSIASLGKNLLG